MGSHTPSVAVPPNVQTQTGAAAVVLTAGVIAAVHVGKLPPAIPVLRAEWGVGLVEAGFLLSLVQVAGMALGLVGGAFADRWGLRRTAALGLLVLGAGSLIGAMAPGLYALLVARALEGVGFLMVVLPCPGLLRHLVRGPADTGRWLGFWGAYMPLGAALGLLLGPWGYSAMGWRWSWALLATATAGWAWVLWRQVPPVVDGPVGGQGWWLAVRHNARATLRSPGPWYLALGFWVYSGQWLAVVGFLPTVYNALGWSAVAVGWLSALAAAVNMVGNIGAGVLAARGVWPARVLVIAYAAMAVAAYLAFAGWEAPWARYLAVLLFSAVGGLVPGTLFGLAVKLAPTPTTVSTTVGWMQQLSALGQFVGPPMVGWVAATMGGWTHTWVFNAACCLGGLVLAWRVHALMRTGVVPVRG
ncbi:MAG: hypothetical protein RJA09_1126 [Pseudomonadota bacterium]|jgi:MFS family permease